jgi:hypothetical protein
MRADRNRFEATFGMCCPETQAIPRKVPVTSPGDTNAQSICVSTKGTRGAAPATPALGVRLRQTKGWWPAPNQPDCQRENFPLPLRP